MRIWSIETRRFCLKYSSETPYTPQCITHPSGLFPTSAIAVSCYIEACHNGKRSFLSCQGKGYRFWFLYVLPKPKNSSWLIVMINTSIKVSVMCIVRDNLNSLWHSNVTQRGRSWSTAVQATVPWRQATRQDLNHSWFIISVALWRQREGNFTVNVHNVSHWNVNVDYKHRIETNPP